MPFVRGGIARAERQRVKPGPPRAAQAERTAQQAGIPIQYKQAVAGGNNAGSIHRSADGVRTLALSLACRYLHAPVSLISEKDYGDYIRLAQRLAEVLPAGEET